MQICEQINDVSFFDAHCIHCPSGMFVYVCVCVCVFFVCMCCCMCRLQLQKNKKVVKILIFAIWSSCLDI